MSMNQHRGNENAVHVAIKAEVQSDVRTIGGGIAVCEDLRTDVAVFRHGGMWGIEVECGQGQHSLANALRDLKQGCERVLFICKDKTVLGKVARQLARALPKEFHARVGVMDITAWRVMHNKPERTV